MAADGKTVTLYSCPTGGWLMGNRYAMESAIKRELGPDCTVNHKLGCILTSTVVANGQSRREFLPLAMILPFNACFKYYEADTTAKLAKSLVSGDVGLPNVDSTPASTLVPS